MISTIDYFTSNCLESQSLAMTYKPSRAAQGLDNLGLKLRPQKKKKKKDKIKKNINKKIILKKKKKYFKL